MLLKGHNAEKLPRNTVVWCFFPLARIHPYWSQIPRPTKAFRALPSHFGASDIGSRYLSWSAIEMFAVFHVMGHTPRWVIKTHVSSLLILLNRRWSLGFVHVWCLMSYLGLGLTL